MHALVRVWITDRPGALGLVASRIGALRGDIVAIEVLERGDGVAVDEFAVDLPGGAVVDVLVREIEQVDGASVEQVKLVEAFPDARIDALESAALLCEASDVGELARVLVDHVRQEFLADWVALVTPTSLTTTGDPPSEAMLRALSEGTGASRAVSSGTIGPEDLGLGLLPGLGGALLVGRDHMAFRARERAQLRALARIADRTWHLLDAG